LRGIIVLRYKSPNLARPFRTRSCDRPILGILICGFMMSSLAGRDMGRLLSGLNIGARDLLLYSRSHSKLARAEGSA